MRDSSRYLIYHLLRRQVDASVPSRGGVKRVSGPVERVYRNVMEGVVEFTIAGRRHVIPEPAAIRQEPGTVVFVYGRPALEDNDEQLFAEANATCESVPAILARTAPAILREFRFRLGPKVHARA